MERKKRSATRLRAALAVTAVAVAAVAVGVLAGRSTASGDGPGSVRNCASYAYQAIRSHTMITALPAACHGLSRSEVNDAASMAIRQAAGYGDKSAWRKQAGAAEPWVSALLTGPAPAVPGPDTGGFSAAPARGSGVAGFAGVSAFAVRVAALLAWLAAAASGGYVLIRWLRAGGRLRRQVSAAEPAGAVGGVPAAVIVGHVGFAVFGLLLWAGFMLTGWIALAWTATGLLGPVAGAGMGVLVLGLPSPGQRASAVVAPAGAVPAGAPPAGAPPAGAPSAGAPSAGAERGCTATLIAPAPAPGGQRSARSRVPVFVIAAHGLFAAVVLLLVVTATIGAG
jgi:hypothetical protein